MSPDLASAALDALLARACRRIAPTWPLDRFIAVNPFWERVDQPIAEAFAEVTALTGARLLMPRGWYREEWERGRLRPEHLRAAIAAEGSTATESHLRARLASDEPITPRRRRVMDLVDEQRDLAHGMSWREFITHRTSQLCAAYFDEGQAQLGPDRDGGLYATWRRHALGDRAPALLQGLGDYRERARALPATAREMAALAIAALGVPAAEQEAWLTGLLLDLNGWAAWCAYRRWTARLAGGDDAHLVDLLAMRLAWEWLLLDAGGAALAARWQAAVAQWPTVDEVRAAQADDWVLQRAVEIAWQEDVCAQLRAPSAAAGEPPVVQAAFCIDVRSEVFRRALEAQSPRVQTLGCAGFFGLPVEYQPVGSARARPHLPGLLAPTLRVTDTGTASDLSSRRTARLALDDAWRRFKTNALSGFTFVEAMGALAGPSLVADSLGLGADHPERAGLSAREHATRRPRLTARKNAWAL